MEERQLTDTALAERAKVGRIHVGRIRRGERGASLKVALKLADATGLPASAFVKEGATA
jgi:transcriptional regulator with XRE-family HTH domain